MIIVFLLKFFCNWRSSHILQTSCIGSINDKTFIFCDMKRNEGLLWQYQVTFCRSSSVGNIVTLCLIWHSVYLDQAVEIYVSCMYSFVAMVFGGHQILEEILGSSDMPWCIAAKNKGWQQWRPESSKYAHNTSREKMEAWRQNKFSIFSISLLNMT
jgi:hypothetical protein